MIQSAKGNLDVDRLFGYKGVLSIVLLQLRKKKVKKVNIES